MIETTLRDNYCSLLQSYFVSPRKDYLAQAARLGRELVMVNIPPEEIAELHEDAVQRLGTGEAKLIDTANRISQPLIELFVAYTTMGFREHLKEREREEAILQRSERELTIRNKIAKVFLTVPDDEMYGEVLTVVLEAMKSKHGVFGYIDENGDPAAPSMTRDVRDQCRIPDKKIVYPRQEWGGIWGRALIEKKTLFSNNPFKVPEGHLPISCALVVPIIHHGESIGTLEVANKATGYDDRDIQLLETIADRIAPILNARIERGEHEKARKQTEEILKQTVADLKRSNTDLEHFAYVVSHDLQEPLRMIRSYMQLLSQRYKGKLDSDADDFIGFAVNGASRMQTLIQDLLTYSRIGTRGNPCEPSDCEDLLKEILANLKLTIEDSGAEVTHDPLPTIMADALQLIQLMQNLIDNAIKFRGEKPPHIHISAQQKENEWEVSVADSGIGIDPQSFDRIFKVFQRLHTKNEYPGTGIGLALCKKIVERHGGRIWVESEPGRGSTFLFTIPAAEGDGLR
ncbi:MAG: sensor histidine kinase [Desulfobacteria bacterium]